MTASLANGSHALVIDTLMDQSFCPKGVHHWKGDNHWAGKKSTEEINLKEPREGRGCR